MLLQNAMGLSEAFRPQEYLCFTFKPDDQVWQGQSKM